MPFAGKNVYWLHEFVVNVAQLVEHQIVALVVVGSIPTIHPIYSRLPGMVKRGKLPLSSFEKLSRDVAQFGSALALGARGCQFESGHPDHFYAQILRLYTPTTI